MAHNGETAVLVFQFLQSYSDIMSASSPLQKDRGNMEFPSTPFLDDKERLVNVDTAITWIKDELVSVTIVSYSPRTDISHCSRL